MEEQATARPAEAGPGGGLAAALGAVACAAGFWGAAAAYGGFRIPYGVGVNEIHPAELVFSAWFLALGIPAVALGARALAASGLADAALAALRALPRGRALCLALACAVGLGALGARLAVLQRAPVADDESTYVFIAQTLLEGRVANPSPGDTDFFRNQFVVLDDATWYGKYPLGHPAVLAVGEALGARDAVGPVLTALALGLAFAVGRRAFGAGVAWVGMALLALSPQFLLTGATLLSQTTSALCMLLACWALLRLDESRALRFAALAGAALGAGVLARPLPGALFAAVAGAWVLLRYQREPVRRQVRRVVAGALPLVLCGLVLLAVHAAQSGDPTRSGYAAYHGGEHGLLRVDRVPLSVFGALLRQNFWLFGWPLSLLFLPLARRDGRAALLWGLVAAEYGYRVLVPKTVVASTGPIYVAEIVPLLALLSASGMAEAAHRLARAGVARARAHVASVALAGTLFAALTFWPVHLRGLHGAASAWNAAHRLLDEAGAERALVFAHSMVPLDRPVSWAYYPPNPTPDLDAPRIFVRPPAGPDAPDRARDFWRRRFPDRQAFLLHFEAGEPRLHPLFAPDGTAGSPAPPRS